MTSQGNRQDDEVSNPTTVVTMTGDLEKDLETGASATAAANTTKPRATAHIQAIQWPPRSPSTMFKNGVKYAYSMHKPLEIIILGVFLLLCYQIPHWAMEQHTRPLPFQTTAAGDVIFDNRFNQPKLPSTFEAGFVADSMTFYAPVAFYVLTGNLLGPKNDAHSAVAMYLWGISTKILVVEAVKRYTGWWRPNFFNAACDFNTTTLDCGDGDGNVGAEHGYQSFPSGHAATAMTSGILWSFYIMGKIVGWARQRQPRNQRYWAPSYFVKVLFLLATAPTLLGIFIAVSRARDDWHHPTDVLAGIELGVGTALFAHAIYYPSIFGRTAGIPRATLAEVECDDDGNDDDEDEE